jgi:hypothetical protein
VDVNATVCLSILECHGVGMYFSRYERNTRKPCTVYAAVVTIVGWSPVSLLVVD